MKAERSMFYKPISALRMPLMAAIVCIHSDFRQAVPALEALPLFNGFMEFFKTYVCFPALYMFFFISGYLFFSGDAFSFSVYKQKIKRRIGSLLRPYLLWNGITLLLIFLCQCLLPGFSLFLKKQVADFRWEDFFLIFWDKQRVTGLAEDPHGPLLLQFWFLQCLMLVQLFAPFFWVGLKRLGVVFLLLLGAFYTFANVPDVAGFQPAAFFFFAVGAYCHQLSQSICENIQLWTLCALLFGIAGHFVPALLTLYYISFFFLLLCVASRLSTLSTPLSLPSSGAVFFVFAFHIFLTGAIAHLLGIWQASWSEPLAFLAFFASVTINIGACLGIYALLRRYMPKLCQLLTGGRN